MNTVTSNELMAMFPALGFEIECGFVFDDGSFAIDMRGHYTPGELRMMCAACEHANTVFQYVPRTKEARAALIAANEQAAALIDMRDTLVRADVHAFIECGELRAIDPTKAGSATYQYTTIADEFEMYALLENL